MEHSFRFPSNKLIRFPSDNHPETVLDVHVKQGMELEELKQIMLNSESFVLDESKIINEFFKPPQSFQESKWKQASEILAHRYLAYRKTLGSETSGEPEGNEFKLLKLALVNPRAIEHVAQFQQGNMCTLDVCV